MYARIGIVVYRHVYCYSTTTTNFYDDNVHSQREWQRVAGARMPTTAFSGW